ncbi:sigma-54-dependent Fis family transcriptional regulator [Halovulum dunhuangense]|uniref:Sigma-54-dependent Fis family transcriptional regulator n=1 Tax=Halovulum dunhuangense TaxID=1505036 RepID=A0A849L2X9_9RHOB|nr:sigma-54 dependent transcriptional regulator [Halovulum dunhuangense]NNU80613.1 sigma-54-dependent Fis family transcriptional regulator [Halovulum dunhuangense]
MASKTLVAIIDDEADMRGSIAQWLTLSGFEAVAYDSGENALKQIRADFPGVVISDIRMPGVDGMMLLKRLQQMDSSLPVILITGHGDVSLAVEAMRGGAYDFIEKPFDPERLAEMVKRAAVTRRLTLDNRNLRREMSDGTMLLRKLVGSSAVIEKLRETILDMAQADGHVLITGETGTGKSLIAHALHACSPRKGKPYVYVNCAAYAPEEIDKVLFGPVEGPGKRPAIEAADGGTLTLENIESLPESTQARLVTELSRPETADVEQAPRNLHIIAISSQITSTETPPEGMREDLFYRVAALHLSTPALRERGEDILILFNRFCAQFAEDYGCEPPELSAEDAARLIQAPWPGNIRQLMNVAERAVLNKRRGEESLSGLLDEGERAGSVSGPHVLVEKPLREHVEAFEKMLIDNALRRNRGSVAAVMEELALPRRTLNEKMAKYGLVRADYI